MTDDQQAVDSPSPETPLACGTRPSDLLDRIADGRPLPEHSARCPYCQSTLDTLSASWSLIRQAAAAPVTTPPRLIPRVLSRIRNEYGVNSDHLQVQSDRGSLRIGSRTIVRLARLAASTVPAVRVRGESYANARITLQIELHSRATLHEVERMIRERVAAELFHTLGVPAPQLDIQVVDVW